MFFESSASAYDLIGFHVPIQFIQIQISTFESKHLAQTTAHLAVPT